MLEVTITQRYVTSVLPSHSSFETYKENKPEELSHQSDSTGQMTDPATDIAVTFLFTTKSRIVLRTTKHSIKLVSGINS
jgi:hypothetical protein